MSCSHYVSVPSASPSPQESRGFTMGLLVGAFVGVVGSCALFAAYGTAPATALFTAPSTQVSTRALTSTARMAVPKAAEEVVQQPVSRRRYMAATTAAVAALWPLQQQPALAAACPGTPVECVYEGTYSDPFHPDGYRTVVSNSDHTATIQGIDKAGGPVWTLTGYYQGADMLIDFRPKGGPANLLAKYEDGGMVFPDGNKWTKQ